MKRHRVACPKRQQRKAAPEEHAQSDGDMLFFSAVVFCFCFFCPLIFDCLSFFVQIFYQQCCVPRAVMSTSGALSGSFGKVGRNTQSSPPSPFLSMLDGPPPPFFNVDWKRLRSDFSTLDLGGRGVFAL